MGESKRNTAKEIAEAVIVFQEQTTGHAPKAVTVVLSQDTLVVTLHEALSPAERDLAKSTSGAAQVQEFHRQLFSTSCQRLQNEIKRITGVEVREAVAEIEPTTSAVVQAFTSSATVQVFRLARAVPGDNWSGSTPVSR
ncbi:MAG TPA: Na-translocating system protein MpsC family protein [Planctomycetota bacterium]|nr:Na-translocating system protein MpsC family protein [Planctomycetota bacterium]